MKKILVVIIISFLSEIGYSQSFNAGAHFGFSATQVTGDRMAGYNKLGLFGGIFVSRPINEISSFSLEMNYIQKGSRKRINPDLPTPFYSMHLHYVEVPILYNRVLRKNLSFEVGLAFGYLIRAWEEDDWGVISNQTLPDFHNFELESIIGLNYKLSKKWKFNFRYSYSIRSIRPIAVGYAYSNGGQYNDVLCTALQYSF